MGYVLLKQLDKGCQSNTGNGLVGRGALPHNCGICGREVTSTQMSGLQIGVQDMWVPRSTWE